MRQPAPRLSSETLHASCVAIGGRAVLIAGRSGAGKSDLALRLIDEGAALVSDDYTIVRREGGRLLASAPPNIAGRIEVRGVGIVRLPAAGEAPVCLFADLDREVERLPEERPPQMVAGVGVPLIGVRALEASAPAKVRVALEHLGLKP